MIQDVAIVTLYAIERPYKANGRTAEPCSSVQRRKNAAEIDHDSISAVKVKVKVSVLAHFL